MNRFAITSTEIGDALQRSASTLSVSGNTIDESIGLITGGQTVIQDADKVGTALKTLSLRIRGAKVELEEAGLEADNMAESTSKLQQKILALTGGKVDIMLDDSTFKSTTQILREMSAVYDSMDDISRTAALELMGGKQQANVLAAILQNFDIVESAIAASAESSGSALAENEKYLDSIQGKINQFNNAVQAMWSDTLDSNLIKGFVELGTILVKIIDQLGVIPSLLLAIGAFKGAKTLFQGFNPTSLLNDIKDLTMGTKVFDATTRKTTLSLLAQQMQFNLASSSLVQYAIKMGLATSADVAKMTTTQLLGLSFKALGTAIVGATKAIIAFLFTNPIGWVILLTGAIAGGIAIFNKFHKTTEELSEELTSLKTELSDLKTELQSVDSELETVQARMAELLAMPSLSFVQQEELKKLQQTNAELQRRKELLTTQQSRLEKHADKKAAETAESRLEDTSYNGTVWDVIGNAANRALQGAIMGATGGALIGGVTAIPGAIIGGIVGAATGVGEELIGNRISTEDKLQQEINGYQDLLKQREQLELELSRASHDKNWWQSESGYDKKKKELEEMEEEILETEKFIDNTLNIMAEDLEGVEYGDGYDDLLDAYHEYKNKWENIYGSEGAKANAIEFVFSKKEFSDVADEIDVYVQKLKDGDASASDAIEGIISENTKLVTELKKNGVEWQDAVDYFILEEGVFDSDTIEGITAQYAEALNVMQTLKGIGKNDKFSIDGVDYNWSEFFSEDDAGELKANAEEFSKILKGMDEDCRKTFMSLVEQVKNGELTWDQAIKSFSHSGNLAGLKVIESQLINLNNVAFANISDDLSGVIDTFSEFKAALDEVAASMDLLNTAQTQMNKAGRISVVTALEIINSTDRWNEILKIENGNITLVGNATSALVEDKLALIKSNLQNALSTVTEQLAMVDATNASDDMAMTMEESTNQAVRKLAGSMAYLTTMTEAYTRAANGEEVDVDYYMGEAEKDQAEAEAALNWKVNSARAIGTAELEKRKAEIEAQLDMLEGIDTVDEFKNNYDFDEKLGDKYADKGSGSDSDDVLDNLRKKYENKIKLLEAQQTYLENEISIAEANDEQVGRAVYDEQIRLEEEKIKLYADELAALKAHMQTLGKGTDEWYECADAVWEVEHSIQESTLAVAEFKQEIANLYIEVFEKIQEAFGKQQELYQKQGEYIRNEIEYAEATDQPVNRDYYLGLRETKQNEYNSAIKEGEALANALKLGVNAEGEPLSDEEIADMTLQLMDSQLKAQGLRNEIAGINNELEDLYITALEKVDEAFAAISDLYSDRRSYVTNQIDINRAQDENYMPVKADYQYLIDQNKSERESLMQEIADYQKMLDDGIAVGDITEGDETWVKYHEHIRDTVLEVQDLDKETAEYINNMKDLWVEAFNKIQSGYDKLGEMRSNRQSYIEKYMELMEVTDQPITTSYYELILDEQQNQYREAVHEIEDLRRKQQEALESGDIEVGTERWWEMESAIQAAEAKAMDFQVQIAQTGEELKNLYYDAFNKVADAFGDEQGVYDDQQAFIDSYIDYLNTMEVGVPAELYEKKIEIERQSLERNMENLNGLYAKRDRMLAQGFTYKDEELVEANSKINEIERSVWESKAAIEEWNKAIRELDISKFEEIQKRISDIFDELENVYGLVSDEDVATEDGVWTDEGITSLGLMIQKMEMAKAQIHEYQNEIDKLTEEYKSGAMSEQEYNDRLVELKNSQWDTVNAYESAKDAIIDIHEARADMIEEGINKEIEAYQELIDVKKEELDAERDLYSFRKNIQDQTRDIAALERKIAAMSGSTDAATVAERTKLEAQLREARENLDDTYYDHAMDSQSSALDDENEAFSKSGEDYIEELRNSLENVEQIVALTMNQVLTDASTVLGTMNTVAGEHGVTLSDALTLPWRNASFDSISLQNTVYGVIESIRWQVESNSPLMQQHLVTPFAEAVAYAQNTFSPDIVEALGAVADEAKRFDPESDAEDKANLSKVFETGLASANTFSTNTITALQNVINLAAAFKPDSNSPIQVDLTGPFKEGEKAASSFDEKVKNVLESIKKNAESYNPVIAKQVQGPPECGMIQWEALGNYADTILDGMVTDAYTAALKISTSMSGIVSDAREAAAELAKVGTAKTGGGDGAEKDTGNRNNDIDNRKQTQKEYVVTSTVTVNGKKFSKTAKSTEKRVAISNAEGDLADAVIDHMSAHGGRDWANSMWEKSWSKKVSTSTPVLVPKYAKGTMGTSNDQWAITDEPWLGDELTMYATSQGTLSYMRAGSTVIPADLTKELMAIGEVGLNGLTDMSNAIQGVSLMSNVVNKPELNLNVENLLRCDNVSHDTLPELKAFVTEELNKFTKNLNYSLRRVGAK